MTKKEWEKRLCGKRIAVPDGGPKKTQYYSGKQLKEKLSQAQWRVKRQQYEQPRRNP